MCLRAHSCLGAGEGRLATWPQAATGVDRTAASHILFPPLTVCRRQLGPYLYNASVSTIMIPSSAIEQRCLLYGISVPSLNTRREKNKLTLKSASTSANLSVLDAAYAAPCSKAAPVTRCTAAVGATCAHKSAGESTSYPACSPYLHTDSLKTTLSWMCRASDTQCALRGESNLSHQNLPLPHVCTHTMLTR